jgi:hypothetical protein
LAKILLSELRMTNQEEIKTRRRGVGAGRGGGNT